jgi:hypothetical protein
MITREIGGTAIGKTDMQDGVSLVEKRARLFEKGVGLRLQPRVSLYLKVSEKPSAFRTPRPVCSRTARYARAGAFFPPITLATGNSRCLPMRVPL